MRNKILDVRTARDIDAVIAKILKGLGNPEPPLNLDDVRALQKLDRQYYSSVEDGALREYISKAYIGAKQVFLRPTLILDIVRKRSLKALYLPDRKRILIDSSEPKLKWRWNESHEIIHDGVPWHQEAMFGDTEITLSPSCHEQIEAEANFGAGRLLFFQNHLREFISLSTPNFALVQAIKEHYGNTLTSSLWRLVEALDIPALGMVGCPPWEALAAGAEPCRYFIRSVKFIEQFANVTEQNACSLLKSCSSRRRGGPIADDDVVLVDDCGQKHVFHLDSFYNRHEVLTILIHKDLLPAKIAVTSVRLPKSPTVIFHP
jgi:hypothetical protein